MVPGRRRQGRAGRQRAGARHHGHPALRLRDLGADAGRAWTAASRRPVRSNAYFPLFIPESLPDARGRARRGLQPRARRRHARRRQGAGGAGRRASDLARPSSASSWRSGSQSYRDLPLLLNQWANVVRWELRPRLFLRTTEFLWQEGHTAHATEEDAGGYAARILRRGLRRRSWSNVLAMPVVARPQDRARDASPAPSTPSRCEAMMRDGKALQMGTSHELGQNFATAFDITYLVAPTARRSSCWHDVVGDLDPHGRRRSSCATATTTGCGCRRRSRRSRCVVMVVKAGEGVAAAGPPRSPTTSLGQRRPVRARRPRRTRRSVDARSTAELKGIPVRVEVGPRDLAERHRHRSSAASPGASRPSPLDGVVGRRSPARSTRTRARCYAVALAAARRSTSVVATIEEAVEAARRGGWAPHPVGGRSARRARPRSPSHAVTVRCLVMPRTGRCRRDRRRPCTRRRRPRVLSEQPSNRKSDPSARLGCGRIALSIGEGGQEAQVASRTRSPGRDVSQASLSGA